jgi:NADP-dependent 3-hydroxy acid dehydrogenase YdfG
MTRADRLKDRVVLITGASSGIGAATALACGAWGARVVLAARRAELLREIAEEIAAAGGEAQICPVDVRDPEQIEGVVRAAVERFGRLDALIANAGIGYSGPMSAVTDVQITETVDVNLLGVIRCARAVLPQMISQKSGHIITVSSVAAGLASPRAAVYAATKAGVHRFTEGLRREVRRHGIYVTDFLPGVIDTPMTANLRGLPKAPVAPIGRAIAGLIGTPRRAVVSPAWYRAVLGLNRMLPWVLDAVFEREARREERTRDT